MNAKYYPFALLTVMITLVACAAQNTEIRPGFDISRNFDNRRSAKYILEEGQRGFIELDGKSFAFELLRINSESNVTIELLGRDKTLDLSGKVTQRETFEGLNGTVGFQLSSVIQGVAVMYVYVNRDERPAPDDKASEVTKIDLHLEILEDTTVKLRLDDGDTKQIALPAETKVRWSATTSAEIELAEAHKVRLEINGVTYKPSEGVDRMHQVVTLKEGRLIIESR